MLEFPEGCQSAQDVIPFSIRSPEFCTQAFCKTQLGLENTRFTG